MSDFACRRARVSTGQSKLVQIRKWQRIRRATRALPLNVDHQARGPLPANKSSNAASVSRDGIHMRRLSRKTDLASIRSLHQEVTAMAASNFDGGILARRNSTDAPACEAPRRPHKAAEVEPGERCLGSRRGRKPVRVICPKIRLPPSFCPPLRLRQV